MNDINNGYDRHLDPQDEEDEGLNHKEVATLIDCVKKFGEIYGNHTVYGMDSTGVHITTDEVIRLSEVYDTKVTIRSIYDEEKNITFVQHRTFIDGVCFNSQDEVGGEIE